MTAEEDDRTPNCNAHKSTIRSREREQLGQHYSKDVRMHHTKTSQQEVPRAQARVLIVCKGCGDAFCLRSGITNVCRACLGTMESMMGS